MEAAAEAALQLLEVAGRLGDQTTGRRLGSSSIGSLVAAGADGDVVVGAKEAGGREGLIIDANAIARLETWLGNVEVAGSLLLLQGSLVLLGVDEAGLLEEHVGRFGLMGLRRLGNAIYKAGEVNLLGLLLGLLLVLRRRRRNVLDEALLDLGAEAADQD